MLSTLTEPLCRTTIEAFANLYSQADTQIVAVGMAAFVLNPYNDLLVLRHKNAVGSDSGALGPVSEKLLDCGDSIEAPLDALQRSLQEELGIGKNGWEQAAPHFDRRSPFNIGLIEYGAGKAIVAVNVHIRGDDARPLCSTDGPRAEVDGSFFAPIESIVATNEPVRPGFLGWVKQQRRVSQRPFMHLIGGNRQFIDWMQTGVTTAGPEDMRFGS